MPTERTVCSICHNTIGRRTITRHGRDQSDVEVYLAGCSNCQGQRAWERERRESASPSWSSSGGSDAFSGGINFFAYVIGALFAVAIVGALLLMARDWVLAHKVLSVVGGGGCCCLATVAFVGWIGLLIIKRRREQS